MRSAARPVIVPPVEFTTTGGALMLTSILVIGYAAMVFGCALVLARAFMRTGRR